uniref:DDHD domain-containing protein n=1 Tax=Glossina austeni TaxID=7395 RepID=A0A1A9VDA7_GLOAU
MLMHLIFLSESKTLVTVGTTSSNDEYLHEINLSNSNEENAIVERTDLNGNSLLQSTNTQSIASDSILIQAASSLSSLPSVASNVFSTFSKRISGISSRDITTTEDNNSFQQTDLGQVNIQNSNVPQTNQQLPTSSSSCNLPQGDVYSQSILTKEEELLHNLPLSETPKLYTPTDIAVLPAPCAPPPSTGNGHNSFRLNAKRKLYAPIPGLSDQNIQSSPILDSLPTDKASNDFPQPFPPSSYYNPKPKECKFGAGLFSNITNLVPEGVLQNISGIVQSATGSITHTNKLGSSPNNNPFLKPDKSGFDVFSSTSPALCTETTPLFSANKQSSPESISVNFFENQVPDNSANISDTFVGNSQTQALETSESSQYSVPQTETSSESSIIGFDSKKDEIDLPKSHTSAQPITDIKTTVNFFHPESSTTPIRPNRPSSRKNITPLLSGQAPSSISGESPFDTTPEIFFFPKSSTQTYPTTSSQQFINYFDPSQISSTTTPASTPLEPPPRAGKGSFRLQKGTKLYKNPFEPQDPSPASVTTILEQQFIPVLRPSTQSQGLLQQFIPHLQAPVSTFSQENSSTITQSVPLLPLSVEEPDHAQKVTNRAKDKSPTSLRNHQGITDFNTLGEQGNLDKQYSNSKVVIIDNSYDSEIAQIGKLAIESIQPENKKKEKENFDKVAGDIGEASNIHSDECAVTSSLIQTVDLNQDSNNLGLETPLTQLSKVCNTGLGNPYRRSPTTSKAKPTQPILANFFAPPTADDCSTNFNFFATFPTIDAESSFSEPFSKRENTIDLTNFFFDTNALTFINSNIIAKPEQSSDTDGSIETQKTCKESSQSKAKSTATSSLSATAKEIFKSERNLISEDNKDKSILKSSSSQIRTSFNFSKPFELTNSEVFKPTPQISQSVPLLTPSPPTEHRVIPSFVEKKENIATHQGETTLDTNIPPPIAFENLITEPVGQSTLSSLTDVFSTEIKPSKADQQKEVLSVNTFLNYFNQSNQTKKEIDSTTFFDNFNQQKPISVVPDRNEEQRLQNFFNNPPNETGDLNYNLIHSGLTNKDLIQRSTPTSILVEPPSSSCSEFSEFINNTAPFSKSKIYSDQSLKESKEKFHRKEATTPPVKDRRKIESVGGKNWEELPEEVLKELRMANLLSSSKGVTTPNAHGSYKPVIKHWFFKRNVGCKHVWTPFSHYDSALLETSVLSKGDNIVAVEGGRYDVYIKERKKFSVYWDSEPIEVRRCSWFYKATDSKYVPYEEETSDLLEAEYKAATESGQWHNTIVLSMGEQVVFHGPTVIVHFQQQQTTDAWGGTSQTTSRPRVVKRDLDDFNIEQGECHKVDHLLFMVHGIGSVCDLKLRTVEEVVEDFRAIARQLVQSHYKNSIEMGSVGRVEVLPVSWHSDLHSREVGIDEQLKSITLESIPKLRNFTNDTLLDVLFYTSPTYCQKIMNTVATSMNATYTKYRERNPDFNGGVSLAGHSLGSLILFDLLCHQNPVKENEEKNLKNPDQPFMTMQSRGDMNQTVLSGGLALEPQHVTYSMGPAGSGQPFIQYVQLIFQPEKFFALGSPIGMFVTIRGIDKLGLDFRLPTCTGFYNIFHPYDPVAYRIEALINPDLSGIRPILISHHKGRKRMHLELKETMTRVSMDLKNRFFDRFKSTLESVDIFGLTSKSRKEAEELMEMEVEKVIEMQRHLEENEGDNQTASDDTKSNVAKTAPRTRTDSNSTAISDDMIEIDFPLGKLNDSKRIDYVLQEAPLEFFNEYIFALSSHVCYWDSEDTILFVMKEIYAGLGVTPDSQVPQQTMTIERPSSCNSLSQASISLSGS